MGVENYLVRDDNRTMFDLSKGPWYALRVGDDGDAVSIDRFDSMDDHEGWTPAEFHDLGQRVREWAEGRLLRRVCDNQEEFYELLDQGYRVTGSRFDEDHFRLSAGVDLDGPPAHVKQG